jgi:oligopeptide/dipeptide ABC transporter ATP-binding protein
VRVATATDGPRLHVEELTVRFATEAEPFVAVDGISFEVPEHTTVALVGESGSGKSVTAQAIMRLLASPPATATGRVHLGEVDLFSLSERQMRRIRGERIAMIFQDPGTALNPVYSIGFQVAEALRIRGKSRREAKRRALELLERVGFPEPRARYGDYPHELSGGMRQRAMIAIALAAEPELLIADEPTTALDMLAAAQINALLADLQREHQMSMLLISHDIAAVAENADEVIVLYAGQIVERGSTDQVLRRPRHPYTRGLLESIPPLRSSRRRRAKTSARLPAMLAEPHRAGLRGCRFAPRCPEALERCREETPRLIAVEDGLARCLLVEEGAAPLELRRARPGPDEREPEREEVGEGDDDDLAAADAELEEALSADAEEKNSVAPSKGGKSRDEEGP